MATDHTMTNEAKEEIHAMVADSLQVLDVPDDCKCSNCGILAIFHFTNVCKHLYCRSCYFLFKREKRNCRKCRKPIGTIIDDSAIDSVIYDLKTECPNGCKDVVTLRVLLNHLENCTISETEQVNGENSDKTIEDLKKILEAKLKKSTDEINAKLEKTTRSFENQLHSTISTFGERFKVVESTLSDLRKDISRVSATCEHLAKQLPKTERTGSSATEVNRSWDNVQLKETCDRVDTVLNDIQSVDAVFLQRTASLSEEVNKCQIKGEKLDRALEAIKVILDSQQSTGQEPDVKKFQQKQVRTLSSAIESLRGPHNGVFVWKVDEYRKNKNLAMKREDGKWLLFSGYFYSSEYGYRMQLQLEFGTDGLGVFLNFSPGVHEAHLPEIFNYRSTYFILDQSDRERKVPISRSFDPCFRDGMSREYMRKEWGFADFCSYHLLEKQFPDTYLKNDRLFVKVVVDPAFDYRISPISFDGMLTWRVANYESTKRESLNKICVAIQSESFYSGCPGYRMQIRLSFTENEYNVQYLHVQLQILQGEYDDNLPDVRAHKVTFSILGPNGCSLKDSLSVVEVFDPDESGDEFVKDFCHTFTLACAVFEKLPFLYDDSILVKLVFQPL